MNLLSLNDLLLTSTSTRPRQASRSDNFLLHDLDGTVPKIFTLIAGPALSSRSSDIQCGWCTFRGTTFELKLHFAHRHLIIAPSNHLQFIDEVRDTLLHQPQVLPGRFRLPTFDRLYLVNSGVDNHLAFELAHFAAVQQIQQAREVNQLLRLWDIDTVQQARDVLQPQRPQGLAQAPWQAAQDIAYADDLSFHPNRRLRPQQQ